jgi:hypothetical protein
VVLVAVDEQEAAAVDRFVHHLGRHLDIAEDGAAVVAQRLVVVAGDDGDVGPVDGRELAHRVGEGAPVHAELLGEGEVQPADELAALAGRAL